jgi:hypothetical protein
VSLVYVRKLGRQFKDGKLNVRSPLSGAATFEELGRELGLAQWQTRKMKEQGLLRETNRHCARKVLDFGHVEVSRVNQSLIPNCPLQYFRG